MPISEKAFYHGAALFKITESEHFTSINKVANVNSPSAYLLNHNTGLYIKYSALENSPWRYKFSPENQDELQRLFDMFGEKTFVVLVCRNTGVCVLGYNVFAACVDMNHRDAEWLEVTKPAGGSFRVRGVRGQHNRAIPLNAFPRQFFL